MQAYNKAIAAFVTPVVLGILLPLGITAETRVEDAITILVIGLCTAAAVYFVRNKKG